MKQLNAYDCLFRNGVDVYFSGEQPGDSADPRCGQVEDAYTGWLEDQPTPPCDEDRKWRMTSLVEKFFPEIEHYVVDVFHKQP